MKTSSVSEPRVEQIARQIEKDLRGRGLRPDAPYLKADEVAEMLGIHVRTAHRALNVLAKRKLLVRKRGCGTFVGPAIDGVGTSPPVVQFLIGASRAHRGIDLAGLVFEAVRQQMPGTGVQFSVLSGGQAEDAKAALSLAHNAGVLSGVVMLGCDRPVQEYVAQLDVPAVVFGGTYATAARLASVDADHAELARLLAERLIERGHRHIAVLMHDFWLPGDNHFFEGVNNVLASAGATCVVRSLPIDRSALQNEAQALAMSESAVTAVICRFRARYEIFAKVLREALKDAGRDPESIEIVFDDTEYHGTSQDAYACVAEPMLAQIEHVIRLMKSLADGASEPGHHFALPVRLVEPENRIH